MPRGRGRTNRLGSLPPPSRAGSTPKPIPDSPRKRSLYANRPVKEGEVRIVTIEPGFGNDPLWCILAVHEDGIAYEALSWTWGRDADGGPRENPEVRFRGEDEPLKVKPNLEKILKQLRKSNGPRSIWVDFISIDQESKSEKSVQVPLMAKIYSEATNVLVWLGPEQEDTEEVFSFIKEKILDLNALKRLIHNKDDAKGWKSLADLMSRPWFSRRWVIQELALARKATLQCGRHTINWEEFATAVAIFEKHSPEVTALARKIEDWENQVDFFGDVQSMGAARLVQTTNMLYRKNDEGEIMNRLLDLESLVSILQTFKSTIPHDTIYAVLALAKDTWLGSSAAKANARRAAPETAGPIDPIVELNDPEKRQLAKMVAAKFRAAKNNASLSESQLQVDYEKSFLEVCKDFITFAVSNSGSLDILCRPWAPELEGGEKLPSWIPTLANFAFGEQITQATAGRYKMKRKNSDPLVGLGNQIGNAKPYSANRGLKPMDFSIGRAAAPNSGRSLFTQGFVYDTVKELGIASQSGNIPEEWFGIAGWNRKWPPPERFWRTLVGDRGADGANTPGYFRRSFQDAVNQSVQGGDVNTTEAIHEGASSLTTEYLRRCQTVIWNRKLMKTTEHEAMGLAPSNSKEGDLICILYGLSVPVALRKVAQAGRNARKQYNLIGECYVHGIMDGEAVVTHRKLQQELSEKGGKRVRSVMEDDTAEMTKVTFEII